ncbi:MAG TPA: PAS domain-containing protein [Firmicutes bacterium]|nr:PAS domain-containing protein [Bacillota bacterium]
MGVVATIEGKCRRCYSCVRNCPVKAIKVENGQAKVVDELCISCGHCVKVCSQNAKHIQDDTQKALTLASGGNAALIVAPSFVAEFPECLPGQVVAAARALGFRYVFEVAWGAERTTREYLDLLKGSKGRRGLISTPCPAIVNLVQKRFPSLIQRLAPVVSPMVATGRMVKSILGADTPVVFVGPCVAKKSEVADENVAGAVDVALTFREFRDSLAARGIHPEDLQPELPDGPRPGLGRLYPVAGGLLRSAAIQADILESDIVVIEGKDDSLEFLDLMARKKVDPEFVDILFCNGCISGPVMTSNLVGHARRRAVVNFVRRGGDYGVSQRLAGRGGHLSSPGPIESPGVEFPDIDARRRFKDQSIKLQTPGEADIRRILAEIGKVRPEDQLNCGACGYGTCREKAVAVFRGLAENKMCLPYLIDRLEKAIEELEALKDYNKNIVDSIAEGIIVVDSNCMITTFNDAGGRVTRLSEGRKPLIGLPLDIALPKLGTEELMRALRHTIATGEPSQFSNHTYDFGDDILTVNIKIYALRNGTNSIHGAVIITEDITERKRLEDQLRQADKLSALGQMAAGVAHEINTPLTLISGYTELLLRELKDKGFEGTIDRLRMVSEEVDRIAEIVRNLLSFARPTRTSSDRCKVNEAIKKTLSLVERQMAYRGISLEVELCSDDPAIIGDSGELEQVFLNIVLNAIQAMPKGGHLWVTSRIEPSTEKNTRWVAIEFRDTGCGIPEENLMKVFDPFFTTKEVGQGTGLGLSVSYGIVRKYGGTISVASRVGKGSVFTIRLPVSA